MTPDERAQLDATLLRNGARFATRHRAVVAERLWPRGKLSHFAKQGLALEAFQQYMLATEDILTWLCALMEWEPGGGPETSILARLDTVRIGQKLAGGRDYRETSLRAKFDAMTVEQFRSALKIPPDDDLVARSVLPPYMRLLIDPELEAWLGGLRAAIAQRIEQGGAWVKAYNKTKHGLLGLFDTDPAGQPAVVLITATGPYTQLPIPISRTFLRALPSDIEKRIARTIRIVAVLQTILAFILGIHFGEWEPAPKWVEDAQKLIV